MKPTDDEVFDYLDQLRTSGEVNMFGATTYLQRDFGLSKKESMALLVEWMELKETDGHTVSTN